MIEKPDCYKCKWRGSVAGSAHSSCKHPEAGTEDKGNNMAELLSMLAHRGATPTTTGASKLEIQCHPHGRRSGWFNWPFNFDPVWLTNCNGFTPKDK